MQFAAGSFKISNITHPSALEPEFAKVVSTHCGISTGHHAAAVAGRSKPGALHK